MHYIGFFEAAEKHISAKIFRENLHRFAKIENLGLNHYHGDREYSHPVTLQNIYSRIELNSQL